MTTTAAAAAEIIEGIPTNAPDSLKRTKLQMKRRRGEAEGQQRRRRSSRQRQTLWHNFPSRRGRRRPHKDTTITSPNKVLINCAEHTHTHRHHTHTRRDTKWKWGKAQKVKGKFSFSRTQNHWKFARARWCSGRVLGCLHRWVVGFAWVFQQRHKAVSETLTEAARQP